MPPSPAISQYLRIIHQATCWLFDISNKLTFDLESGVRVTWATSMPILVFLGLSVLELVRGTRETSDKSIT